MCNAEAMILNCKVNSHSIFSKNKLGCKGYLLWEIISPTMEEEALPIWAYHRAKITSVKLVVGKTGSRFIDALKRGHFSSTVESGFSEVF